MRRLARSSLASLVAAGALLGGALGADAAATAPARAATPTTHTTHTAHATRTSGGVVSTPQWKEGEVRGPWRLEYHGYGTVSSGRDTVRLAPASAREPGVTHGSLVTSRRTYRDVDVTALMRTDRQLRTGSAPNPWESAWLLWHHTDDLHFYALALKPNGWELSKEDPAYPGAQRYLATGSTPRFPIGSTARVRVRQQGATIRVEVDGRHLVTYTDRERPYRAGSIGLYTEDAAVTFTRVRQFGRPLS